MKIKDILIANENKLNSVRQRDLIYLFANLFDSGNINDSIKVKKEVIGLLNDYHFDEYSAEKCVEKMYYDDNGKKYAPYWDFEEVKKVYNNYKDKEDILKEYNVYDFFVVLNMIKSDNYKLYKNRFSGYSESQLDKLFIEDAINWLDDKDNPFGTHKAWKYFNS